MVFLFWTYNALNEQYSNDLQQGYFILKKLEIS